MFSVESCSHLENGSILPFELLEKDIINHEIIGFGTPGVVVVVILKH